MKKKRETGGWVFLREKRGRRQKNSQSGVVSRVSCDSSRISRKKPLSGRPRTEGKVGYNVKGGRAGNVKQES